MSLCSRWNLLFDEGTWDTITPLYWIGFDYRGGGNEDCHKINFGLAYIFPAFAFLTLTRSPFSDMIEYLSVPSTLWCRLTLTRVADVFKCQHRCPRVAAT